MDYRGMLQYFSRRISWSSAEKNKVQMIIHIFSLACKQLNCCFQCLLNFITLVICCAINIGFVNLCPVYFERERLRKISAVVLCFSKTIMFVFSFSVSLNLGSGTVHVHKSPAQSLGKYWTENSDVNVSCTRGMFIIIRVFLARAGLSLQTQAPRLQFAQRHVFHLKCRNQGCSFTKDE